jgi:hypothetical protein
VLHGSHIIDYGGGPPTRGRSIYALSNLALRDLTLTLLLLVLVLLSLALIRFARFHRPASLRVRSRARGCWLLAVSALVRVASSLVFRKCSAIYQQLLRKHINIS